MPRSLVISLRSPATALATLFVAVATFAATDLALDLREGTTPSHLVVEGALLAAALGGLAWVVRHARSLAADLRTSRAEAARWRADVNDLVTGVAGRIDEQLERWRLTAAEKDVALLLLKGLSHKEIAGLRDVNETTVRQQARAIYRKSGLGGRADLAAFFLEDLLGPR
jgi:DNA-binding NarL/FixJ family response regulator